MYYLFSKNNLKKKNKPHEERLRVKDGRLNMCLLLPPRILLKQERRAFRRSEQGDNSKHILEALRADGWVITDLESYIQNWDWGMQKRNSTCNAPPSPTPDSERSSTGDRRYLWKWGKGGLKNRRWVRRLSPPLYGLPWSLSQHLPLPALVDTWAYFSGEGEQDHV